MGTAISGNAAIATWGGLDISADTTTISLSDTFGTQSAAHRGATAASVPGEHTIEVTIGFIGLSEAGAIFKAASLRPTSTGNRADLVLKWQGNVSGGPIETMTQALLTGRSVNAEVNGLVDGEFSWSAGAITYGAVV